MVSALKKAPRIPPSAITGGRRGLLRGTWPRLATVSGPSFCPQTKSGSCEAALVRIGRKNSFIASEKRVQRNQKPPNLTRVPPNSKAVGGEPANGFAFVPIRVNTLGCRTDRGNERTKPLNARSPTTQTSSRGATFLRRRNVEFEHRSRTIFGRVDSRGLTRLRELHPAGVICLNLIAARRRRTRAIIPISSSLLLLLTD